MGERIDIVINAEEVLRALEKIDAKIEETEEKAEEVIEAVETAVTISYNQVLNMARATWLMTQGVVRAAGGAISATFRMAVGTALGAISVLIPIFTAEAVTPFMQAQAALGMISIGIAIAALAAAQQEEQELALQFRGANMALHGIQSIIGSLNF